MSKRYWMGPKPVECDTCAAPIKDVFYDMATRRGPWACMCPTCATLGPGIGKTGTGLGQKYERSRLGADSDGKFYKTEG